MQAAFGATGAAVGEAVGSVVGEAVGSVVGEAVGSVVDNAEGAGVGSAVVGVSVGDMDTVGAMDTVGLAVGGAVTSSVGAGDTVASSHVLAHRRQSLLRPDVFNAVADRKLFPLSQLSAATAQTSNANSPGDVTVTQAPVWALSQPHSGPVNAVLCGPRYSSLPEQVPALAAQYWMFVSGL